MKNSKPVYFFIFLFINCALNAQSTDSLSAHKIIGKESKGDVIHGKKIKQDQLKNTPVLLRSTDTISKTEAIRHSKKHRRKNSNHN